MSHPPKKRKNLYKLIFGFCQNLFFSFRGFHQGMLHWYPALPVHKGQGIYGPTPNFFPEQRITYQDLHGFSQSFYHLFIIFILLLRLGQKSRELSYPEEKSTALSAGQPTDETELLYSTPQPKRRHSHCSLPGVLGAPSPCTP